MSDKFDNFVDGYLDAVLWVGVSQMYGDEYTSEDIRSDYLSSEEAFDDKCLEEILVDCDNFFEEASKFIEIDGTDADTMQRAGADFFLTRNGHGAGFWDGGWTEGDVLTTIAEPYGSTDYTLDDNTLLVYC